MHILIIPSEFYNDPLKPLAGVFQQDQAELLQSSGHTVGILAIKPKFTISELLRSTFKRKVGYVRFLSLREAWGMMWRRLIFKSSRFVSVHLAEGLQIAKFHSSYSIFSNKSKAKRAQWISIGQSAMELYVADFGKPDIIHAHNLLFGGMLGNQLSEKYKIPCLLTEHSSVHDMSNFSPEDLALISAEYKRVNKISAVSPSLARSLEQKYDLEVNSVVWFPNLLRKELAERSKRKSNHYFDSKGPVRFLNIASLIPIKNHRLLIEAFDLLSKEHSNIQLEIIGGGHLETALKEMVAQFGLDDKVIFLGQLERSVVLNKIEAADFIVHSSKYETFGVVFIEALAFGKAVLSTACGGPECIVNQDNGILVPLNDPQLFANGMKRLMLDGENFNREKIRTEVMEAFGERAFHQRALKLYSECIEVN